MRKFTKIFIYIILWVLFVQNGFFAVVSAQTNSCETPSIDEECGYYGRGYSYDWDTCCICENPAIWWACDSYGEWYINDGSNCCVYSCYTCSQPSLVFQTYVNFQVEMLQTLRKAAREEEEKKSNTRVGLFSAGILSLPKRLLESWKQMFKAWVEEMTTAYRSAKIWAIMLWSITSEIVSKDGVWWIAILFRNEPFVRERSTLQDLDMSIHDAMWDLGTKWLWEEDISNEIMQDIMQLKAKYEVDLENEYGLFVRFDIKWNVKYKDMVNMMLRLNSIMKNFIAIDAERVDTKIAEKGGVTMQFNEKLMEIMYDNYDCAQWISACNSAWEDFAKNTKVRSTIKKWLTEAWDTIKKANDELSQAMLSFKSSTKDTFSKDDEDDELGLTPKQLTLLRTVYGIDTTKLSKEQAIWLESLLNWSAGKKVVTSMWIKPLDYFSAENKALREEARKEKERNKQDAKYLAALAQEETTEAENKYKDFLNIDNILRNWLVDDTTLSSDTFFSDFMKGEYNSMKKDDKSKQEIIESLYNSIKLELWLNASVIWLKDSLNNALNSVLAQKQEDKWVFMIYSNLWVTRYFVEIWALIHDIVEKDIGTKDSKWLIKYLWNACEAQCLNKWNTNCYAQ